MGLYYRDPILPSQYVVSAASTATIVTLDELRAHLNLFDDTTYDTYLTRLVRAGQDAAESYIGEFFSLTEVQAFYPRLGERFQLPHRQVDGIASLAYYDSSNVLTTITGSAYLYDNTAINKSLKITDDSFLNADLSQDYESPVIVTYNALVEGNNITEGVAQAILLYCSSMFANRENYKLNQVVQLLPMASERLLDSLKRNIV